MSFPRPTQMFQFRRFPTYCYLIHSTLIRYCRTGFPHSDISGSMLICSSPKLFAACHVLHRLLMPRHSPCALISLTSSQQTSYPSPCRRRQVSSIPLLLLFKSKPAFRFEISGSQIIIEQNYAGSLSSFTFQKLYLTLKNNCSLLLPSHNLHHFSWCSFFKVHP